MAILTVPGPEELQALASAYDLGPLHESRGIQAGTVNTSYALRLGEKRYFLRIYEEQAEDGARREAALLLHLSRAGVPTPPPLADKNGALTRAIAGKPCALFPWIDGDMLCQRAVQASDAEAVGEALARIHLAGPGGADPGPGRFGPKDLIVRCDRVATSTDEAARAEQDRLREAVRAAAARRDPSLPSGLIHGDLFRDNVLWSAFSRPRNIAALLDFESASHGPFAYDVAVTVLSWAYSTELVPSVARGIADGYRRVRDLTEPERAAMHDEAVLAALRFTITRITDEAIRVGKRWQRFVARREAVERLGPSGFREMLGL
jgi:homoserine kinase type II